MNIKDMTFFDKIDFMKKIHSEEIDTYDETGDDSKEYYLFKDIQEDLFQNGDISMIRPLMELFDDQCYELSWMHTLADIIWVTAERYGNEGILEVLESLRYVPDVGELHRTIALQMGLYSYDSSTFEQVFKDISNETRHIVKYILEEEIVGIERLENIRKLLLKKLVR